MQKSLLALAAFFSLGVSAAHADSTLESPFAFELGVTTHNELYEEFDTANQKIMQEKGTLVGLKGSAIRKLSSESSLILSGEFATGDSTYTGSYQGGNYGDLRVGGLSRYLLDVSGTYKHSVPQWSDVAFSGGLGYRRLTDNLQEAGAGGYKRINDRLYLTLGVEKPIHAGAWTVTPGLQLRTSLWSNQHSALNGGLDKKQKDASGHELFVSFLHKPTNIAVTPFLRAWDADDSEVVGGYYEPRNDTREVGVAVSYRF